MSVASSLTTAVLVSLHLGACKCCAWLLASQTQLRLSSTRPCALLSPSGSHTCLLVASLWIMWPLPAGSHVLDAYVSALPSDAMLFTDAFTAAVLKACKEGLPWPHCGVPHGLNALQVIGNVTKLVNFLTAGNASSFASGNLDPQVARELLPFVGPIVQEMLPRLSRDLFSRISARILRELYVGPTAAAV